MSDFDLSTSYLAFNIKLVYLNYHQTFASSDLPQNGYRKNHHQAGFSKLSQLMIAF